MAVPKQERLILFDFDDEEDDDINFTENALSEEKSPAFDKDEDKSSPIVIDEDMGDDIYSTLDEFKQNKSLFVERQDSEDFLESPMENWCLSSDEEVGKNASEKDIFEEQSSVTHDAGNSNPEEIIGDTRYQVQNILGKFKGDIHKTLYIKRKHMETYVKDSFKGSNRKLEQGWKINKQERKKINNKFFKQYITTFQKFDVDIQKFNNKQEKSAKNYQKKQKAFQLSKTSQNQALQAIRDMHNKFMKSLKNLETNNYDTLFDVDGELRKEMSAFKTNIMRHTLKYSSLNTSD
ncbi:X-linked lymphocyte-regulated protein PM1-like [Arvicanthis niloticus]|uniref:X-linked lymphocyte-regulated protein PM1-like n=1 Tax=Arvicanthis niloticus TaxID=61156 RepID=UPI00402BCE74